MKNITVSVDEETHRLARIRAAELDTSDSALVSNCLRVLAGDHSKKSVTMKQAREREFERRRQLMGEVIDDIRAARSGFRGSNGSRQFDPRRVVRPRQSPGGSHGDSCRRAQSSRAQVKLVRFVDTKKHWSDCGRQHSGTIDVLLERVGYRTLHSIG